MFPEISTQTNQELVKDKFPSIQLSYSTADIERSIFYESEFRPINPSEPIEATKIMVVHGDMYTLEEGEIPQPSIPLTERSGIFQMVDLLKNQIPNER